MHPFAGYFFFLLCVFFVFLDLKKSDIFEVGGEEKKKREREGCEVPQSEFEASTENSEVINAGTSDEPMLTTPLNMLHSPLLRAEIPGTPWVYAPRALASLSTRKVVTLQGSVPPCHITSHHSYNASHPDESTTTTLAARRRCKRKPKIRWEVGSLFFLFVFYCMDFGHIMLELKKVGDIFFGKGEKEGVSTIKR